MGCWVSTEFEILEMALTSWLRGVLFHKLNRVDPSKKSIEWEANHDFL